MARSSLTPAARAFKVRDAAQQVAALVSHAEQVSADLGYEHPSALSAWTAVEEQGATIHRQARLLAGKSRGG